LEEASDESKGKKLACGRVLIGAIVVATIFAGRQYILSRRAPETVAIQPAPAVPESMPDTSRNSDSAPSVELSDEEQKAIGVETVEVKRQTIHKEIVVLGARSNSDRCHTRPE